MKNPPNSFSKHEKFIEVWNLVHSNIRMFSYWLKKGELSIPESRLLKAFYFYKKNKKEECLALLKVKMSEDTFLEAMRFYLIGLTYNQFCHYTHAIENLKYSILLFEKAEENEFVLNPLCVLANVYGNRREILLMAECVDKIKECPARTDLRKIQVMYAEICFYNISGQYQKARSLYQKVQKKGFPEYEVFKPYFIAIMFMIYSKEKKYEHCYQILKEYTQLSGCLVTANYNYNKSLLDLIVKNAPFYIYSRDFEGFPEMHHQLEVIKALKSGDSQTANKFWKKLTQHNPSLYYDNFEANGDDTLFFQALNIYKKNLNPVKVSIDDLKKMDSNLKKMHYIFTHINSPMTYAELIHLIWNEEVTEKTLARLRKLVSDYSKKYQVELQTSQATYQLANKIA